jgi:hypothetical protein
MLENKGYGFYNLVKKKFFFLGEKIYSIFFLIFHTGIFYDRKNT